MRNVSLCNLHLWMQAAGLGSYNILDLSRLLNLFLNKWYLTIKEWFVYNGKWRRPYYYITTSAFNHIYCTLYSLYFCSKPDFGSCSKSQWHPTGSPKLPHEISALLFSPHDVPSVGEFSWLIRDYKRHPVLDPYWRMSVKERKDVFLMKYSKETRKGSFQHTFNIS